jgi:nucleotide-binding universal stress UspA family protein
MSATNASSETVTLGNYYPAAPAKRSGPILAATDRTDASLPALRAAAILNGEFHGGVTVLAVVVPLPIIVPEPTSLLQPLVITPELSSVVRQQALDQIKKIDEALPGWVVEVEEGRPSREIASAASTLDSRLVILGLSHHGLVDRLIDGDTALELLRESDVPLLLASKHFKSLPRTAVIAVDFSPESMAAARTAIPLLAADAVVHLVHVRPPVTIFDGSGLWEEEYERVATQQLEKFEQVLDAPAGMRTEKKIVAGKPAAALAQFAGGIDADLIVSGTHGAGLMRRIFVGSVASGLLRKSEQSLLIVPLQRHDERSDM